jgi:hypothetical protein
MFGRFFNENVTVNMKDNPYKSQPYLPEIFGNMNMTSSKKDVAQYTIHYPKSDLICLAERESKVLKWSNMNAAIINRLTSKRYPLNHFAELEKAALSKRLEQCPKEVCSTVMAPIHKRRGKIKETYLPLKSIKQIEHNNKVDKEIKNEEIDLMLIQKPVVIYLKRIKSY